MNLILCGFKSCGKTTVGKIFAQKYNYNFIDTDHLMLNTHKISEKNKKSISISELYAILGAENFRKLESEVILNLKDLTRTVISTGGGAIINKENCLHLKSLGKLVYLYISCEKLYSRLKLKNKIPVFIEKNNFDAFEKYFYERKNIYSQYANFILDTTDKNLQQIIFYLKKNYGEINGK